LAIWQDHLKYPEIFWCMGRYYSVPVGLLMRLFFGNIALCQAGPEMGAYLLLTMLAFLTNPQNMQLLHRLRQHTTPDTAAHQLLIRNCCVG
jgi:hypothetical protein